MGPALGFASPTLPPSPPKHCSKWIKEVEEELHHHTTGASRRDRLRQQHILRLARDRQGRPTLAVNHDGNQVVLAKEVRHLTWLGFRVPTAVRLLGDRAAERYPHALALQAALRAWSATVRCLCGPSLSDPPPCMHALRTSMYRSQTHLPPQKINAHRARRWRAGRRWGRCWRGTLWYGFPVGGGVLWGSGDVVGLEMEGGDGGGLECAAVCGWLVTGFTHW